jgi:hypothetical protein
LSFFAWNLISSKVIKIFLGFKNIKINHDKMLHLFINTIWL